MASELQNSTEFSLRIPLNWMSGVFIQILQEISHELVTLSKSTIKMLHFESVNQFSLLTSKVAKAAILFNESGKKSDEPIE